MSTESRDDAILSAQSIAMSFGAQPVLKDISLTLHDGERLGLIGRNGSGKSTLLKIMAGAITPVDGLVTRRQGLRIGMLDQNCTLDPEKAVGGVLEDAGRALRELIDEHETLSDRMVHTAPDSPEHRALENRYAELHHQLDVAGAWSLTHDIKRISIALNLPGHERLAGTLSGGELRRLDLAATILSKPDVLLLDEPTNHVDMATVEWVEHYLANYSGSLILVTHDRYFLELVVTRIVEIEFNRIFSFPGNYAEFMRRKLDLHGVESRTEMGRQNLLRRELAWLQRGPKARSTKQKARIRRYDELESEEGLRIQKELTLEIPQPQRLSKRILEADHLAFGYGDTPLFENFTYIFQKGMRVGVVGPNGCGKTALLRVLMGVEEPTSGTLFISEATDFLYVDQTHEEIDPNQTILNFVSNGANYWDINGRRMYVPAYLERLLFDMDSVKMPMRNLSGGERNRIELAKKLLRGGNFIILDEPTNDLDLATLRVLEEALRSFDGCAMVVSHDRYFLNRICTHLLAFEDDGSIAHIAGNYDDYLLWRERTRRDGAPARPVPKRPAKDPRPAHGAGRLTYLERKELGEIEAAIEAAETEVEGVEGRVHEPGFYERDYKKVQEILSALEAAKAETERLYRRWHDLEERANIK